ncbi:MAG TPA: hypothetical protein VJ206_05285 [bacterium]|nr:hypothetical protein [bacterium]
MADRTQDWLKQAIRDLEHLHLRQEAWGYIPARYPNSHAEGTAFEHYGELHSTQAIDYAREILAYVRAQMA